MADTHIFSDVHLEAEQVTETHRTLNADHTVTEAELPGTVDVYVVIDGGRLLLTQFPGSRVQDAIKAQADQQQQPDQQQADQQQPPAPEPPASPQG